MDLADGAVQAALTRRWGELYAGRRVLLASDGCHTDPTVVPADTALWLGASI